MKRQIELMIARLERENEQLKKVLKTFEKDLTEEETDEMLAKIYQALQIIEKLKKGL